MEIEMFRHIIWLGGWDGLWLVRQANWFHQVLLKSGWFLWKYPGELTNGFASAPKYFALFYFKGKSLLMFENPCEV